MILWPYHDASVSGHYFNAYWKGALKYDEASYAMFVGLNRANGHFLVQQAVSGAADGAITFATMFDLRQPDGAVVGDWLIDFDGSKTGTCNKLSGNANQGFWSVNEYYNSGIKYTRAGHAGRLNVDVQNGGFQVYLAVGGSQDAAVTEILAFEVTEASGLKIPVITAPSGNPPAGFVYLFQDVADNKLKFKDAGGATHTVTSS